MQEKNISLIVATDENGIIGRDGHMPWHIPADLQYFRQVTWGKSVIMGRKTRESVGRPLPGRQNIVMSTDPGFYAEGCETATSPESALEKATHREIMIIGGALIYPLFLPMARHFYLTLVHAAFAGDTRFPAWQPQDWQEVARTRVDKDPVSGLSYSFIRFERIVPPDSVTLHRPRQP
jgi:dihydrofolate reductase